MFTFVLVFCALAAQVEMHENFGEYLIDPFERGLSYLEANMQNPDINATFNIVVAKGELIYLEMTKTDLSDAVKTRLEGYKQRFDFFINYVKENEPDAYPVENLFDAEQWVSDGDYKFKKDLVSGPASTKSVTEIYGISIMYDEACDDELYANKNSDVARSCGISKGCMDKMTNVNEEGTVAPMQRLIYLSSLRYLKCTENPSDSFEIATDLCNLIYKQILTLTAAGYNEKKAYYYMDKILLCGTYGFAEFYNDDILQTLMDNQQADGSIGTESAEVKNVLTSQYIAILSSAYRLKIGSCM